ncbi:hypothetical protein Tco_0019768 [Tanacetum coccineum]
MGSSTDGNDEALARLMVAEYASQTNLFLSVKKEDRVTYLQLKSMKMDMQQKKIERYIVVQQRDSYENGDYDEDPYDDDIYEGKDNPDKIQDIYIYNNLGIEPEILFEMGRSRIGGQPPGESDLHGPGE